MQIFKSRHEELMFIKRWCITMLCVVIIGTASVAYAYAGDQIPKTPPTEALLALAASFHVK